MAVTLLFYNFKGGVGKTTLSVIAADHLSRCKKKVLLIDLDAQASATQIMEVSYGTITIKKELRNSLNDNTLEESVVTLDDYLDIIPSDWSMSLWNQDTEKLTKHDRDLVLKKDLLSLKNNYDYIILDVPPTLSTLVNNAVLASDYVALVLQTQRSSYESVLNTIQYLSQLQTDYANESNFDLVGIILYLVSRNGATDLDIVKKAKDLFGNSIFTNQILRRERVKMWANHGITHKKNDIHDKQTHEMYSLVLHELLYRIGMDEN